MGNVTTVEVEKIGVIGAGQMGSGIAQVAASVGLLPVIVFDVSPTQCDKAKSGIHNSISKLTEKGVLTTETAKQALENLSFTQSIQDLADCDVVIEAAPEDLDLKTKIFAELDQICKPSAILTSNTSSIPLTKLAAVTQRPQQVMGMHYMNPVPLMVLVELIRADQTSETTYETIKALAEKFGKTVVTSKDTPGFLANRVLMPMLNEAMYALYEGIGSAEDIDTTMKLGMRHPMGPLQLADFIGLDTCLAIMNVLYDGFANEKYKPCPLLQELVEAGKFGKKSSQGFYRY